MPIFQASTPKPLLPTERNGNTLPQFVHDYIAIGAAEGSRNDALHKAAQQFKAAMLDQHEAEARLLPRAMADGLSQSEAKQAIASAFRSSKVVEPLKFATPSDAGKTISAGRPKKLGFIDALRAAFEPSETIAVVESRLNESGEWKPSVATLKTLEGWEKWAEKMGGDIDRLCGKTPGGMFIGINPYKAGADRRSNDNVAVFRHVLAEWDGLPVDQQYERLIASGLPLSVIVSSGGKSVHGWIRVDASSKEEWEKRRDIAHKLLGCDVKNKDLARVSRCPGAHRGEVEQKVMGLKVGAKTWAEWEQRNAWVPPSWGIFDLVNDGPDLPPEVIEGVLRKGCVMQIASGPKMRKSWLLADLALSVSEGLDWLGMKTVSGPVFIADAENQAALIRSRLPVVAASRGIAITAEMNDRIRVAPLRWQLRGKSLPEIVAGVVRSIQSMPEPPVIAILEPLYLLLRGAKEKEAEEVTLALEELDAVCEKVGCAIVFVHHFSKGTQSGKASMDRASGSGALSRFPDAIITLTPPDEPKKGEPKPDYDATVSMDLRWFPKQPDFPIWWMSGHYEPNTRKITLAKSDDASRFANRLKAMPPLIANEDVSRCQVCAWIANELSDDESFDLKRASALFHTLTSDTKHAGYFISQSENGIWQGIEWDEDGALEERCNPVIATDDDIPF